MFIYMQFKFAILILYFHMDNILRVCHITNAKGKNVYVYKRAQFNCGLQTGGEMNSTENKCNSLWGTFFYIFLILRAVYF